MNRRSLCRRGFLKTAAASAAALPYWFTGRAAPAAAHYQSKNDRPLIAAVGVGGQGTGDLRWAARFGNVVAVCDADLAHAQRADRSSATSRRSTRITASCSTARTSS